MDPYFSRYPKNFNKTFNQKKCISKNKDIRRLYKTTNCFTDKVLLLNNVYNNKCLWSAHSPDNDSFFSFCNLTESSSQFVIINDNKSCKYIILDVNHKTCLSCKGEGRVKSVIYNENIEDLSTLWSVERNDSYYRLINNDGFHLSSSIWNNHASGESKQNITKQQWVFNYAITKYNGYSWNISKSENGYYLQLGINKSYYIDEWDSEPIGTCGYKWKYNMATSIIDLYGFSDNIFISSHKIELINPPIGSDKELEDLCLIDYGNWDYQGCYWSMDDSGNLKLVNKSFTDFTINKLTNYPSGIINSCGGTWLYNTETLEINLSISYTDGSEGSRFYTNYLINLPSDERSRNN